MSGRVIHTVGHSTHAAPELIALLAGHGVGRVLDVRRVPRSRRVPDADARTLEPALEEAGIGYRHLPALGGWRRPAPDSPNAGWRNTSFRGYADHLQTDEGRAALAELEALACAPERPAALMCAEALWWRCHRRLLADALVARGWRVCHIASTGGSSAHALPPFAVAGDAGVMYPPPQPPLEGL